MKPSIKNLIFFITVKYVIFYIFMMFKNDNYFLLKVFELKKFQDIVFYLLIFLMMPLIYCILFLFPLYYSFKLGPLYLLLILFLVFALEYIVYTLLASPSDYYNGIINLLIGIVLYLIMFGKSLKQKL